MSRARDESRPPREPGKRIELEFERAPNQVFRVTSGVNASGYETIELRVWFRRADNGRWFRSSGLSVRPGESADVARALLEGARRLRA